MMCSRCGCECGGTCVGRDITAQHCYLGMQKPPVREHQAAKKLLNNINVNQKGGKVNVANQ